MCATRARLWFRYKMCTLQPWYLRKLLRWRNFQILELRTWWKHKHSLSLGVGFGLEKVLCHFQYWKQKWGKRGKKRRTGCLVAAGSTDDACPNHRTLVSFQDAFVLLQAPCPHTFIFIIYGRLSQISPGLCLWYSVGLHWTVPIWRFTTHSCVLVVLNIDEN
jgi:hypothetical protein